MNTKFTGYWTFFCNPAKWEIDLFLATNSEYDTYQISKWQKDNFYPGQLGVIRVGLDKRTKVQLNGREKINSGIYAIVEVLSVAKIRENKPDKFWRNWTEKELEKSTVEIRYLKNLLNSPLLLSNLKLDKIISTDEYLLNGFQASSMPLRKTAFERVIEIIGSSDQIFENIETEKIESFIDIADLENKYRNASPHVKEVISKRIERGLISKSIKRLFEYKCKICEALEINSIGFRKNSGEYYIETHHIIPVSKLSQGSLSFSNLITVCPNHHRQLHYGNAEVVEITETYFKFKIDEKEIQIDKIKIE